MNTAARVAVIGAVAALVGCTARVVRTADVSPGVVDGSAIAGWSCTATSCEVPAEPPASAGDTRYRYTVTRYRCSRFKDQAVVIPDTVDGDD